MEKSSIVPRNNNIVIEVTKLPVMEDGVYVGEGALGSKTTSQFYYGTALKLGTDANLADQCPEVREGDGVIFDQGVGYHLDTEDGFCKLVTGHGIVAICSNLDDMNEKTIKPTGNRILVKILGEDVVEDGVYDPTAKNPREADTQRGVVISCASGADQIEAGTIVAFDPYCGNLVVNEGDNKLKTVNSFDILFSIQD